MSTRGRAPPGTRHLIMQTTRAHVPAHVEIWQLRGNQDYVSKGHSEISSVNITRKAKVTLLANARREIKLLE